MTQLYKMKNGGIGHYCDVYKENVVEELANMPKSKLINYVNELVKKPSHFGNDAERLRKALKVIKSTNSSVSMLNLSLDVIADVEYHKVFSSDKSVSEPTKYLIKKFRGNYWGFLVQWM